MKTLANRMLMFAASAVVLGTMAHGQTQLKVEVPFAFRAGTANLPAGSYLIYRVLFRETPSLVLEDAASHHAVYAVSAHVDLHEKVNEPCVIFACISGNCSLSKVKMDGGTLVYPAPHKAVGDQGAVSIVSIPLKSRTGD